MLMSENRDMGRLAELVQQHSALVSDIERGMARRVVGQHALVRSLLTCLLTDGHILLEGMPGLAKTRAVSTLAELVKADFGRVQFTPDLLPADVTGTLVYSQRGERFEVHRGPIFANFVLADEINRAPAKVQSALLEAMQERQVTIGDETLALPKPFMVLATQNPIEQEGTYVLPEAQVDRFMMKVLVDYPSAEEERSIVRSHLTSEEANSVVPVASTADVEAAREVVKQVYVDDRIVGYVADLVLATRNPENCGAKNLRGYVRFGGSPRASISLALAARATAFMAGRGYVVPEDVRVVAPSVLRHRIGLTYEAEADEVTTDMVITELLNCVQVP